MILRRYLIPLKGRRLNVDLLTDVIRYNEAIRVSSFSSHVTNSQSADDTGQHKKTTDQVINRLRSNFQKTLNSFPDKKSTVRRSGYDYVAVKPPENLPRPRPIAATEDREVDTQLTNQLERNNLTNALGLLMKFSLDNRYPTRKTIGKMASLCAAKGDVEGVNCIRDVCDVAYPVESAVQMRFKHYEAEALWRNGLYSESLDLFRDLYVQHPLNRRKITNLSAFCFRHIVNEKKVKFYSKLLEFVSCMAQLNNLTPGANLWRLTFCSDSFEAQRISDQLLELYPQLSEKLNVKLAAIIEEANSRGDVNLFHRLMTVAIRLNWTDLKPTILGAYIDHLCFVNDVNGVRECLKYVSNYSIVIPAASMEKSLLLLATNNKLPKQKIIERDLDDKSSTKFHF